MIFRLALGVFFTISGLIGSLDEPSDNDTGSIGFCQGLLEGLTKNFGSRLEVKLEGCWFFFH